MSGVSRRISRAAWRVPLGPALMGTVLGLLPIALPADVPTARLDIEVTDIEETRGSIVIAVFGSEQTFDERIDPVAQARLPVISDAVSWEAVLEAPAVYAVIVYQDLNENGEIDMGRFGRPREPYGFSNDARGVFGPPGFEETRFLLEPGGLSIVITVD